MRRYSKTKLFLKPFGFVMFVMCTQVLVAQHQTSSPYSMFGVGVVNQGGDVTSSAMGGVGIALPSQTRINTLNPASLSAIDSLTFLMDAQLVGFKSEYGTSSATQQTSDANFDAISFAFRVKPWWGCAFGMNSYSQTGYEFNTSSYILGSMSTYQTVYQGSGGLTRFNFSNGFRLFNGLSVGIDASYIWGQLVATETGDFTSISGESMINERTYHLNNFHLSGGLQYQLALGNNNRLFLGAVANTKTRLATGYNQAITGSGGTEYVNKDYRANDYELPAGWGAGVALNYHRSWTFAVDYRFSKWSDVANTMRYAKYTDSYGLNGGVEFAPQKNSYQSILNRMKYRAGAFYRDTYLKIKDNDIIERGFSLGLSVPLRQSKNAINIAYEYKLLGTHDNGLIKEQVNTIKLGLLLSENWFYKSKFE